MEYDLETLNDFLLVAWPGVSAKRDWYYYFNDWVRLVADSFIFLSLFNVERREGVSHRPPTGQPYATFIRSWQTVFPAISSGLLVTQVFHPNWLPPPRPDYFYNFSWRPPSLVVGATLWPPWSETRLTPRYRPCTCSPLIFIRRANDAGAPPPRLTKLSVRSPCLV